MKKYLSTTNTNITVSSTKYVSNVDFACYLYKSTAASEAYCMVELGNAVGFIENVSGTEYAKVKYNDTIGYINKSYLSDSQSYIDTTVKYNMYVNTDNAAFKASPTDGGTVTNYLSMGTSVGYIMNMQKATKYAKVLYDGTIGYILYSSLSDSAPATEPPSPTPAPSTPDGPPVNQDDDTPDDFDDVDNSELDVFIGDYSSSEGISLTINADGTATFFVEWLTTIDGNVEILSSTTIAIQGTDADGNPITLEFDISSGIVTITSSTWSYLPTSDEFLLF